MNAAFTFEDPGFTARDYLGEDLTSRVVVTGTVTSYLVGEYALTYAVADDYGNSTRIERTVTVQPVPLPELVPPPEKTIYLTFDDGPGDHTALLLDILKKYDVKATFFVVGSRRRKDLIKRAFDEGHSIGVHTFTHDYDKMYTSLDAYFQDFLATQEVIRDQTGQYTTLFRFPGGSGNTASISRCRGLMTQLTKIMEDMGYRYFDWNCSAGDSNFHSGQSASHYSSVLCGKVKKDGSHPDPAARSEPKQHPGPGLLHPLGPEKGLRLPAAGHDQPRGPLPGQKLIPPARPPLFGEGAFFSAPKEVLQLPYNSLTTM